MADPESVIRCDDDDCDRVVALVEGDGVLDIRVRHAGRSHHTRIPLQDLTARENRDIDVTSPTPD